MIRHFHPVGQGAFCTELFEDFSVVYDCGTETDQSILEREIHDFFIGAQSFEMLFLSHLHYDHVSSADQHVRRKKPGVYYR